MKLRALEWELELLLATIRVKCAWPLAEEIRPVSSLKNGKQTRAIFSASSEGPPALRKSLFVSLPADLSHPETKDLGREEASFIERYLELADRLLSAAELEETKKKTG